MSTAATTTQTVFLHERAGSQYRGFQKSASIALAIGITVSALHAHAQTFEVIAQRNQEAPQSGGAKFNSIKLESVAISAS
ncbi:MAG: hypothetical protein AAFV29_21605, partial [Myxococcota bacterium]